MKRTITLLSAFFCITLMMAQNNYKQDFLLMLNKLPDIRNVDAAYNYMSCKNDACKAYIGQQTIQRRATKELADLSTANTTTITAAGNGMSNADMQNMAAKLEKMTDEEKQQWAMQNAQNFMPTASAHVNQDMGNEVVTDAVNYVAGQSGKTMEDINWFAELGKKLQSITLKYQAQKDVLVKKFQAESKTQHNPLVSSSYVFGEASDAEVARFDAALATFKKDIVPVLNSELNEKIAYLMQQRQVLAGKYRMTEDKIIATNYIADAEEPSNRGFLINAHLNVLQQVMSFYPQVEAVILDSANQYATIFGMGQVKNFTIPE